MRLLRRRQRRGASAVDFVLTFSLAFVPIFFGLIEYSWFFFQQLQFEEAARAALRDCAGLPQTSDPAGTLEADIGTYLQNYQVNGTVTVEALVTGVTPQEVLELDLTVTYTPLIGFVPTPDNHVGTWSARLEDQTT